MLHAGDQGNVLIHMDVRAAVHVDGSGIPHAEHIGQEVAEALLPEFRQVGHDAHRTPGRFRPEAPGFDLSVDIDGLAQQHHVHVFCGQLIHGDMLVPVQGLVCVQDKVCQIRPHTCTGYGNFLQAGSLRFQHIVCEAFHVTAVISEGIPGGGQRHRALVLQRISIMVGAVIQVQGIVLLLHLGIQTRMQPEAGGLAILVLDFCDGILYIGQFALQVDRRAIAFAFNLYPFQGQRGGGVNGDAVHTVGAFQRYHRVCIDVGAFVGGGIVFVVPVLQGKVVSLGDGDHVAARSGINSHASGIVPHVNADGIIARACEDIHAVFGFSAVDDVDCIVAVPGIHIQGLDIVADHKAQPVVAEACFDINDAAGLIQVDCIHAISGADDGSFCPLRQFQVDDIIVIGGGNGCSGFIADLHGHFVWKVFAAVQNQLAALAPVRRFRGIISVFDSNRVVRIQNDAVHDDLYAVNGDVTLHDGLSFALHAIRAGILGADLQLEVIRFFPVSDGNLCLDVAFIGGVSAQNNLNTAGQLPCHRQQGVVNLRLQRALGQRRIGSVGRSRRGQRYGSCRRRGQGDAQRRGGPQRHRSILGKNRQLVFGLFILAIVFFGLFSWLFCRQAAVLFFAVFNGIFIHLGCFWIPG